MWLGYSTFAILIMIASSLGMNSKIFLKYYGIIPYNAAITSHPLNGLYIKKLTKSTSLIKT